MTDGQGMERFRPTQEKLDALVRRIVETVHPLRVILFGSAAREGIEHAHDIDLLIVMPDGAPRRKTAQRLYRELPGDRPPLDILVTTPSLLEKHRNSIGLIYPTILDEGREVYAV